MLKTPLAAHSDINLDTWVPLSWWRHQRETFSAFLAPCVQAIHQSHVGNADLLCFICCYTKQAAWLSVKLGDLRSHGVHVELQ